MFFVLAFILVLFAQAQTVAGVCTLWGAASGQTMLAGTYTSCFYISNGVNVVALFDDTGTISLHYGAKVPQEIVPATDMVLWTSNSAGAQATFQLNTIGVLSVVNADGTIRWSTMPQGTLYPGRPQSHNLWSVSLDGYGLSVAYSRVSVWKSTGGTVYAFSMPLGTSLGPNQYIQADTSYLLLQLDGNTCTYDGIYPAFSGVPTCIKSQQ